MPKKNNIIKENIAGSFYVDDACIGCRLCAEIAPANFTSDSDDTIGYGYDFVSKQPVNQAEEASCREAMDNCPVNAIGDDG